MITTISEQGLNDIIKKLDCNKCLQLNFETVNPIRLMSYLNTKVLVFILSSKNKDYIDIIFKNKDPMESLFVFISENLKENEFVICFNV
ncbi:hypothetical protein SJAV_25670 [Sulfurisphaera javensis]|uniref:Uncharacterized protein n=1 Tax=Sulfurisphaera javensis TaxID=2049879 RepID=A0AAT9GUW9_9CREN